MSKPHIRPRSDGQISVEYRLPSMKAAIQLGRGPTQYGLTQASNYQGVWTSLVDEGHTGDWQKNIRIASQHNLLGFGAVYACISMISGDISKLRIGLRKWDPVKKIWPEILPQEVHGNDASAPILDLLRKPNSYQTRIQFISAWIISKLLYGNVYVAKERDRPGGTVLAEHVLDPSLVVPLVSPDGDVFYALKRDYLAGISDLNIVVPASEIMHDRMNCFWHPLIGIPPLFAAALSGSQGLAIQSNAQKFFANQSRPSGILLAPGPINKDKAKEIKDRWEAGFGGDNIGKTAVLGDAMTYQAMTIAAEQAQLAEQWGLTGEDVARCFLVPPYKIGIEKGRPVANVTELDQDYYSQCLQPYIESIESCQDEGLSLDQDVVIKFDLDGLFRMDPLGRAETNLKRVQAGELAPNEARASSNLPPVKGGEDPYLQQQNYSLAALAKRDAAADPFGTTAPPVVQPPAPMPAPSAREVALEVIAAIPHPPTINELADAVASILPQPVQEKSELVPTVAEIAEAVALILPKPAVPEKSEPAPTVAEIAEAVALILPKPKAEKSESEIMREYTDAIVLKFQRAA